MPRVLSLLAAMILFSFAPAMAAKRVALVIGNASYEAVGSLANPLNDVPIIVKSLRDIGFEVEVATNVRKQDLVSLLVAFGERSSEAEIALLYYAGHGIEFNGDNYLVPIDAKLKTQASAPLEAVKLADVRDMMSNASKLRVVVLDACRNNPFELKPKKGVRASRSRGLAAVKPDSNEMIVYSAQEGVVADDGPPNGNSPFAKSLSRWLVEPGLEINFVIRNVRDEVRKNTGSSDDREGPQVPYFEFSLGSEQIFLKPAVEQAAKTGDQEQQAKKPVQSADDTCQQAFEAAGNDADLLDVVQNTCAGSIWAGLAEAKIKKARTALLERDAAANAGDPGAQADISLEAVVQIAAGNASVPLPDAPVLGAGFVIDPAGIVVTSSYTVDNVAELEVRLRDGTRLRAELLGRDPPTGIALLRVRSDRPLPVVRLGDSRALAVGDGVFAASDALGTTGAKLLGSVTALDVNLNSGPFDTFIETSVALPKGNVGGPLFNAAGETVGINTALVKTAEAVQDKLFSIPWALAEGVVEQLRSRGEIRRGFLGLKIQLVTESLAKNLALDRARGVVVEEVVAGGPGEKAGLKAGDVVVEFNGRPLTKLQDLPRFAAEMDVGASAALKVLRKGGELTMTAVIGSRAEGEKLMADSDRAATLKPLKLLGMDLSPLTGDLRAKHAFDAGIAGVVVTGVDAGSSAAEKQLQAGDVISEVGGMPVTAPLAIQSIVKADTNAGKTTALLLVLKGGNKNDMRFVTVKIE